jgi:acyl-CoA hydrolase
MSEHIQEKIQAKLIDVDYALSLFQSGDFFLTGLGQSESRAILLKLHTLAGKVKDVHVGSCLNMLNYEYITSPACVDTFVHESWFFTPALRAAYKNGNVTYIPNHLSLATKNFLSFRKINIFAAMVSWPDEHGYMSFLSNVYEKEMADAADIVILEINKKCPRTFGENQIHLDEVDYLIAVDYAVPELPDAEPTENDKKIADFIVHEIEDGSTIQLGIGGTPSAVAAGLVGKKDIGIHTEMFTTSMAKLIKAGTITGKKKNINRGLHVCSFIMGTKELYDFVDNNPSVLVLAGSKGVSPAYIGQNDKQVSINSTLQVDLTGQCSSESFGTMIFSGTGGQSDTARGAVLSKGGKSFIVVHSTATVKDKVTGEKKLISRIVPQLDIGSGVSLQRNDVDRIVTEYGIAYLQGRSLFDRCEQLIAIAHPQFRDELRAQAIAYGLLPKR